MEISLVKLNSFLGRAALATYAGGGAEVDPEEPGFNELEYKEKDWHYKIVILVFFNLWGRKLFGLRGSLLEIKFRVVEW